MQSLPDNYAQRKEKRRRTKGWNIRRRGREGRTPANKGNRRLELVAIVLELRLVDDGREDEVEPVEENDGNKVAVEPDEKKDKVAEDAHFIEEIVVPHIIEEY